MTEVDFEKALTQLEEDVLSLGHMVEGAISRSVESLQKRDLALATETVRRDQEIDQKRFAIEEDCMRIITATHPSGSALRTIIAVLIISNELERMGDYAEGIANITLMIGDQPPLKPLVDIPQMAQKGVDMLRGSLQSFLERDVERAKCICQDDDEVDALYEQVFRELLLFVIEHPRTITRATWLIWVAHNLERCADRVTNICERVVFMVTGKMEEIGASKY